MSYLRNSILILLLPFCLWAQQAFTPSLQWALDTMAVESGSPISVIVAGGAKLWATTKCEGDSALWDSTVNQYARISQSATTQLILTDESGSVEFAFYINKYVTNGSHFHISQSATNWILLAIIGSATNIEFTLSHKGNSVTNTLSSTLNDCQDSTWYWIRLQWQLGADTTLMMAVYDNNAGTVGALRTKVTSTAPLTAFTTNAQYIDFGSTAYSAAASSNFIDAITCYKGWYWWNPYKLSTTSGHDFKKYKTNKTWKRF